MKISKIGLILGYLLLSIAITISLIGTGGEYSLSPYNGMYATWAGILIAACCGVTVLTLGSPRLRPLSITLGFLSMMAAVTLPLLTTTFYYGSADPLSHLGAVKSILSGTFDLSSLFYPLFHAYSIEFVHLLHLPPSRALLLAATCILSIWFLGSFVLLREFGSSKGTVVAALVPLIVLPINPVSIYPRPHPATLAVFFLPLVLFSFVRKSDRRIGFCFIVLFLTLILLHPMVALFTGALLMSWPLSQAAISRLTVVGEQRRPFISDSRIGVILALIGLTMVVVYILDQSVFQNALVATLAKADSVSAGAETASKTGSLSAVGGDLVTFGLKIGAKYLIFGFFSVIALVGAIRRSNPRVAGLAFGAAPIVPATAVFVVAGQINLWSRLLALLMVVGTILATAGLLYSRETIAGLHSERLANIALTVLILGTLLVAFPVLHLSPYIYSSNEQVPQDHTNSYEHLFEHTQPDSTIIQLRQPPYRFHQAIYGPFPSPSSGQEQFDDSRVVQAPNHFASEGLPARSEPSYMLITPADPPRETELYNGFRFSRTDFRHLDTTESVIYDSNGGTIYHDPGT